MQPQSKELECEVKPRIWLRLHVKRIFRAVKGKTPFWEPDLISRVDPVEAYRVPRKSAETARWKNFGGSPIFTLALASARILTVSHEFRGNLSVLVRTFGIYGSWHVSGCSLARAATSCEQAL